MNYFKTDILKKSFKILQKTFYQKFWNVFCVKNIRASGINNFNNMYQMQRNALCTLCNF